MKVFSSFVLVAGMLAAFTVPFASGIEVAGNCESSKAPWVTDVPDLKGYWPLTQDWRDYSGGQKHLTTPVHSKAKKPTLVSSGGPTGGGYTDFDQPGLDGKMNVLAVEDYDGSTSDGSYTWEFWFKVDSESSHAGWFLSYAIPGNSNELFISTGHETKQACNAGSSGEVRGPNDTPKLCEASDSVEWS